MWPWTLRFEKKKCNFAKNQNWSLNHLHFETQKILNFHTKVKNIIWYLDNLETSFYNVQVMAYTWSLEVLDLSKLSVRISNTYENKDILRHWDF